MWLEAKPKKFKLLFVSYSGREYMVELMRVGIALEEPPFIAYEQKDDTIVANDVRFSSLDSLASSFGCMLGDFTSVDQTN